MSETLPSLTANGQKLIDRLLTLPQGWVTAAMLAESIGVSASGSNDERVRRIQRELAANRDTMLIFDEADHHAHPVRQGSRADD